jgi:hypothetical protein
LHLVSLAQAFVNERMLLMLIFMTGLFVGIAAVGVIKGLLAIWRDVQYRRDTMQLIRGIRDF